MTRATIIDYGLGNLASVARALQFLGAEAEITSAPDKILAAERLVLPGVGAFGVAMANLGERGLIEPLKAYASSGRALLGLCLGMQLFMERSDEDGMHEGLGLVPGGVIRIPDAKSKRYKVPHIGWASLQPADADWDHTVLRGLKAGDALYFVHSYYVEPARASDAIAWTTYGDIRYCSMLARGNVIGCQAHPEKSAAAGLRLLGNFLRMQAR